MNEDLFRLLCCVTAKHGHTVVKWRPNFTTPGQWDLPEAAETLHVFNLVTQTWKSYHCTGPSPSSALDCCGEVIGDKLYVIKATAMTVHVLDLKSHVWENINRPAGTLPILCTRISSWAWDDRIYIFGGYGPSPNPSNPDHAASSFIFSKIFGLDAFGFNNQCVAFNTRTKSWEWPHCSGDSPPPPRSGTSCVVSGEYMLLFGGSNKEEILNDLYTLHMPSHRWRKLQGDGIMKELPLPRCYHSCTMIGKNKAIVHGGMSYMQRLTDCWLLTWSDGEGGIEDFEWSRWQTGSLKNRYMHRAICSRDSSRVYFISSELDASGERETPVSFLISPPSLWQSSLETVLKREDLPHHHLTDLLLRTAWKN